MYKNQVTVTLFRCVTTFLRTYATRPKCGEWIFRWLYDAAMGGWRPGINYYRLRGLWARLISWKNRKEKEKEKIWKKKKRKRKRKKKKNYMWEGRCTREVPYGIFSFPATKTPLSGKNYISKGEEGEVVYSMNVNPHRALRLPQSGPIRRRDMESPNGCAGGVCRECQGLT